MLPLQHCTPAIHIKITIIRASTFTNPADTVNTITITGTRMRTAVKPVMHRLVCIATA